MRPAHTVDELLSMLQDAGWRLKSTSSTKKGYTVTGEGPHGEKVKRQGERLVDAIASLVGAAKRSTRMFSARTAGWIPTVGDRIMVKPDLVKGLGWKPKNPLWEADMLDYPEAEIVEILPSSRPDGWPLYRVKGDRVGQSGDGLLLRQEQMVPIDGYQTERDTPEVPDTLPPHWSAWREAGFAPEERFKQGDRVDVYDFDGSGDWVVTHEGAYILGAPSIKRDERNPTWKPEIRWPVGGVDYRGRTLWLPDHRLKPAQNVAPDTLPEDSDEWRLDSDTPEQSEGLVRNAGAGNDWVEQFEENVHNLRQKDVFDSTGLTPEQRYNEVAVTEEHLPNNGERVIVTAPSGAEREAIMFGSSYEPMTGPKGSTRVWVKDEDGDITDFLLGRWQVRPATQVGSPFSPESPEQAAGLIRGASSDRPFKVGDLVYQMEPVRKPKPADKVDEWQEGGMSVTNLPEPNVHAMRGALRIVRLTELRSYGPNGGITPAAVVVHDMTPEEIAEYGEPTPQIVNLSSLQHVEDSAPDALPPHWASRIANEWTETSELNLWAERAWEAFEQGLGKGIDGLSGYGAVADYLIKHEGAPEGEAMKAAKTAWKRWLNMQGDIEAAGEIHGEGWSDVKPQPLDAGWQERLEGLPRYQGNTMDEPSNQYVMRLLQSDPQILHEATIYADTPDEDDGVRSLQKLVRNLLLEDPKVPANIWHKIDWYGLYDALQSSAPDVVPDAWSEEGELNPDDTTTFIIATDYDPELGDELRAEVEMGHWTPERLREIATRHFDSSDGTIAGVHPDAIDWNTVGMHFEEMERLEEDDPITMPNAPEPGIGRWNEVKDSPQQMEDMVRGAGWHESNYDPVDPLSLYSGQTGDDGMPLTEGMRVQDAAGRKGRITGFHGDGDAVFVQFEGEQGDQIVRASGLQRISHRRLTARYAKHLMQRLSLKGRAKKFIDPMNIEIEKPEWQIVTPVEIPQPPVPAKEPAPEEQPETEEDPDVDVPDAPPEEWPEEAPEDPNEDPDEWEEVEEEEHEEEREKVPAGRKRRIPVRASWNEVVAGVQNPSNKTPNYYMDSDFTYRALNVVQDGDSLKLVSGGSGGHAMEWPKRQPVEAGCAKGGNHVVPASMKQFEVGDVVVITGAERTGDNLEGDSGRVIGIEGDADRHDRRYEVEIPDYGTLFLTPDEIELPTSDIDPKMSPFPGCTCGIYSVGVDQLDMMRSYMSDPFVIVKLKTWGSTMKGIGGAQTSQFALPWEIYVPEDCTYFGKFSSEQVAAILQEEYGAKGIVVDPPVNLKPSDYPRDMAKGVHYAFEKDDIAGAISFLEDQRRVQRTEDGNFRFIEPEFHFAEDGSTLSKVNDAYAVLARAAGATLDDAFATSLNGFQRSFAWTNSELKYNRGPEIIVLAGDQPVAVVVLRMRDGEVLPKPKAFVGDEHEATMFAQALSTIDMQDLNWLDHFFDQGEGAVESEFGEYVVLSADALSEAEIDEWLEDQGKYYTDTYSSGPAISGKQISPDASYSGSVDFIANSQGELVAAIEMDTDDGYRDDEVLGVWGDAKVIREYVATQGGLKWSQSVSQGRDDDGYPYIDSDEYLDGETYTIDDLSDLSRFNEDYIDWEGGIVEDYHDSKKDWDGDTDDYGIQVWKDVIERYNSDTIDFTPDAWVDIATELLEHYLESPDEFEWSYGDELKKLTSLPERMKAESGNAFWNGDWASHNSDDTEQMDLIPRVVDAATRMRPANEWAEVQEVNTLADDIGAQPMMPMPPVSPADFTEGDRIRFPDGAEGTLEGMGTVSGWATMDDGSRRNVYPGMVQNLTNPRVPQGRAMQQPLFDAQEYWQEGVAPSREANEFIDLLKQSIEDAQRKHGTGSHGRQWGYQNPQQSVASLRLASRSLPVAVLSRAGGVATVRTEQGAVWKVAEAALD